MTLKIYWKGIQTMNKQIVKIENLNVKIGRKKILDNVHIQFQKGESVVIAGRNGAGKSTFLRCLAKVILPDQGSIVYSAEVTPEKIGFISDRISLFENLIDRRVSPISFLFW